jgi:ABC-type nitrate/sulfonate/bicarbonate transport system substrate-binding protein
MWWVTNDPSIQSVEDLEGETVAVPFGSGSFAVADAAVREVTGSSVEELAGETINAPGPGGSPPEVVTGNASVGLSWEPALSSFVVQDNDLEPIINVREQYRNLFDSDSFHLVWAVKKEVIENNPDAVEGLLQASQDVASLYDDDLDGAIDSLVTETENSPEQIREAFDSGRLEFAMDSLDVHREAIESQLDVFNELDVIDEVPSDDIYHEV